VFVSKRYDQYCPVAHAVGVLGERWTLLVVRDLMKGPKRYTDLVESLPRIGTNILAARLKELEAAGVVEKKKLPPPAASTVYELTPYGYDLRRVLHELARWGARSLGPPPLESLNEGWLVGALETALSPVAVPGRVAFRVGAEEATLVDGQPVVGVADDADVLVECDAIGFYHLVVNRQLDGVRIEGDGELLLRLLDGFAPATTDALPA
jgi:DNA-binding HxlR family transcriptional regulator